MTLKPLPWERTKSRCGVKKPGFETDFGGPPKARRVHDLRVCLVSGRGYGPEAAPGVSPGTPTPIQVITCACREGSKVVK